MPLDQRNRVSRDDAFQNRSFGTRFIHDFHLRENQYGEKSMPIYSTGVDLAEIDRIERVLHQYGERFIKRVFTPHEIAYCSRKAAAASSYAARFATKEAVFKATGIGLSMGMRWRDVEVVNDKRGKPSVRLYGIAAERLQGKKVHLSISHSRNLAIAVVVVEDG